MRLDIIDLSFEYSNAKILSDIGLSINGPQFVSIIGPNGVGKSTLIHCINKILQPKTGCVMINDTDVSSISLKDMAKTVGYVPYKSSETFPLTVVDAVLLGRNPHAGWKTTKEDLRIVYDVLKKLEIEDLAMRRFNELSAGQRQRVMLARGLVQEPKAILLDEPTSNLDIKHQLGISRLLRDLSREKDLLVIVISHDLNIAAKYSDHVILLSEGKVFAIGNPFDVLTEDNIRNVYGVDCRVINDKGIPHIILDDDSEVRPAPADSYCLKNEIRCQDSIGAERSE